jgi:hypothetical protein
MAFSPDVVERLLVACHRHCCICHKPAGNKMEIHHIVPKSEGGEDTEENGIPFCFDCHAEVGSYNPRHPKGRKFTPTELKKHKEQWFAICAIPPWQETLSPPERRAVEVAIIDDRIFRDLRVDDRRPAERLVYAIMQQETHIREEFVKRVFAGLESEDEDTRWKFSFLVEELVLWEPRLVPSDVLEKMSRDSFFSVRSSVAVCYYYLARLDPAEVPLGTLSQLAAYDEDWYVATPATGALLRLARVRPVVIDIIARNLDHKDPQAREYSAATIKRLAQVDWDLVSDELISHMQKSPDPFVRKTAEECEKIKKEADKGPRRDYGMF